MRAAQGQANTAQATAGQNAAAYQSAAQAEQGQLTPFYQKELNAQHSITPEQINELLTSAGAGAGGSTAAMEGQQAQQAARTRNSANSTLTDALQRGQQQSMATASEGIAAQDVEGAQQKQQEGAEGLANLYGQNTNAALKSMGLQSQDIGEEVAAGNSGWFQNMTGLITALRGAGVQKSNGAGFTA